MHYKLFVPKQAVGANLVYFDLFNAAYSGVSLQVVSLLPVVSGAVAHTGELGVDLFLTRTTAVGTGGTAATRDGVALDAATFSGLDNSQELLAAVTARLTPTGGATAGAVLAFGKVFTEETNAGTYTPWQMIQTPVVVRSGSGLRVVQGAVAATGNIGFDVIVKVLAS